MPARTFQPETIAASFDQASVDELRHRLRAVGVAVVVCGEDGVIAEGASANNTKKAGDWLVDLLVRTKMFRSAVRKAFAEQSSDGGSAARELMPGLWITMTPIVSRRRIVGVSVAIIVSDRFVDCEQLAALCQSASADLKLTRRLLGQLPPIAESEVQRLAELVRGVQADHWRLNEENEAVESLGKQLAESYEELSLLYSITADMTVRQQPERFVAHVCQELLETLSYSWVGALLVDDQSRLKNLAGQLILSGDPSRKVSEIRKAGRSVLSNIASGAPIIVDAARNSGNENIRALGDSVVVHPVTSHEAVIGLLIAAGKQGPEAVVSNVDVKLIGATATHLSIFLENAGLYHDLNAMFLGTLEALTASIDAKDRYTCGHSRRVSLLTQKLAKAIGLDDFTVSRMQIAGLVHDVGKIGVPEAVLLKPGRLTTEEFALIQKHPEIGHRILKDIPQLADVLPGVLYHHERWDGRGYPQGLAAEQIPLIARLIGLVDAFDAMGTTRIYRPSLTRRQVLDEIAKCSGTQFDPQLARVFVRLDFADFDEMVSEHRAVDLGESEAVREKAA